MNPDAPFLSVVLRTQGKRLAELEEALLCLAAQDCGDFEVLLIGHKLSEDGLAVVQRAIDSTPTFLRERIRFLRLEQGGRAAPLNFGFAEARGRYVAIFDDDDLLMPDWVGAFRELERSHPGHILHAFTVTQAWRRGTLPGALVAVGPVQDEYCERFDFLRQLYDNRCHISSLAFPARLFQEEQCRFDETLTTIEDWDYLMRAMQLAPVADTERVTSLYRKWEDGNSKTEHDVREWERNERTLMRKTDRAGLVLASGAIPEVTRLHRQMRRDPAGLYLDEYRLVAQLCTDPEAGTWAALYGRNGDIYPAFAHSFTALAVQGARGAVRLFPALISNVTVQDFSARVVLSSGEEQTFGLWDIAHNGRVVGSDLLFYRDPPLIELALPPGFVVDEVHASGTLLAGLAPEVLDALFDRSG